MSKLPLNKNFHEWQKDGGFFVDCDGQQYCSYLVFFKKGNYIKTFFVWEYKEGIFSLSECCDGNVVYNTMKCSEKFPDAGTMYNIKMFDLYEKNAPKYPPKKDAAEIAAYEYADIKSHYPNNELRGFDDIKNAIHAILNEPVKIIDWVSRCGGELQLCKRDGKLWTVNYENDVLNVTLMSNRREKLVRKAFEKFSNMPEIDVEKYINEGQHLKSKQNSGKDR